MKSGRGGGLGCSRYGKKKEKLHVICKAFKFHISDECAMFFETPNGLMTFGGDLIRGGALTCLLPPCCCVRFA